MGERRIVPGYEWLTVDRKGNCWNTRFQRLYKGEIDKYGYRRVNTRYKGKRARCLAHRAVALAFIPNPENLPTINHKNAIKTDNRVENLEWATYQDQADHVKSMNLRGTQLGEDTSNCKYSEDTIRKVCRLIEDGYRNCDIVRELKVQTKLPSDIRRGRSWTHISKDYTFRFRGKNRLSKEAVAWVCKQLSNGLSVSQLLEKTVNVRITLSTVENIKARKAYTNISKNYMF